jgi:hypothetical protein
VLLAEVVDAKAHLGVVVVENRIEFLEECLTHVNSRVACSLSQGPSANFIVFFILFIMHHSFKLHDISGTGAELHRKVASVLEVVTAAVCGDLCGVGGAAYGHVGIVCACDVTLKLIANTLESNCRHSDVLVASNKVNR